MVLSQPPGELKLIRPCIHRGNQMLKPDPVIAYYCYYWAIKQALDRKLHIATQECTTYMLQLMDETEKMKAQMEGNELITDDMAASAYVENFAMKVFNNGSKPVEARTANARTPDALQAAVTFLELLKIFNDELDPEVSKKIKYAKFHAARILKAVKEGTELNPPSTSAVEEPAAAPATPDALSQEAPPQSPPRPTVEEVPDSFYAIEKSIANTSIDNQSLHPSRQSPALTPAPAPFPAPPPQSLHDEPGISPVNALPLPPPPPAPLKLPLGPQQPLLQPSSPLRSLLQPSSPPKPEGYFPPVPTVQEPAPPALSPMTLGPTNTALPESHAFQPPPAQPPSIPPPPAFPLAPSLFPSAPPSAPTAYIPPPPQAPPSFHRPPDNFAAAPAQAPAVAVPPPLKPRSEITPEDIAKAQKFAKWAISALDYDDIDNAILQFRRGLACLGER